MSNLFGNIGNSPKMNRQTLESRFSAARSNLLIMIAFTAINLVMLATNSGYYFLFSASIPYIIVDISMFICGMYPEEFYIGDFEGMAYVDKSFFTVILVIAFIILAAYLVCWIFSKKNKVGWIIAALVMFSMDTLVMLGYYGIDFSMIVDIAFHIWVIVILSMGISAHYKLKKLPAEETLIEGEFTELPVDEEATEEKNTEVVLEQIETHPEAEVDGKIDN